MRKVPIALAGLLVASPWAASCGSGEPETKTLPRVVSTEVAAGRTVRLTDAGPVPRRVIAGPGDRITWRNESSAPREVRLMDGTAPSGPIAPGGAYARTFSTSGTFAYRLVLTPASTEKADSGQDGGKRAGNGSGKSAAPVPDGVVEINLPAVRP
ncbi:hypothetical protein ETD83_29300 [Actinomadura soli]|uniref:Plastocyanin n=1 Tax=Actinomadura soli TaxID=2508997 RepID=A0A5C4J6E2_9ACTN|nr:hypothetical protein [Actinomadura soli]TMQ91778.1 hypothetical protein ETD83_29300 [Actinomadura soli]